MAQPAAAAAAAPAKDPFKGESFLEEIRKGDPKGIAAGMIRANYHLVDLNGGMLAASRAGQMGMLQLMHRELKARQQQTGTGSIRIKAYNWAIDGACLGPDEKVATAMVEWLLEEQAKDQDPVASVELPMASAAYSGFLGLVQLFYTRIPAEKRERAANRALYQAAWMGRRKVIRWLMLEAGATEWGPALRHLDRELLLQLRTHKPKLFAHFKLVVHQ